SGAATPLPPTPPTGHPRRPDPHTVCAGEARARTAVRPTHPYAPAARGQRRRSPRHPPPVTRAALTRTPFARAKPALEPPSVPPTPTPPPRAGPHPAAPGPTPRPP